MSFLLREHCRRHMEEPVADHCRVCDGPFCTHCLVYPFGEKKPPYCLGCALKASGVRSNAGGRPVPKRERERRRKAEAEIAAHASSDKSSKRGLFRRKDRKDSVEPAAWGESEGRVPSMAELGVIDPRRT